ncbi:TonB-dependent receptor [Desertivirga brevis]|uniref:TonB-dependent receptor n=1 Tax=Desertivirga brevis TaxID=2810310 RepID=UPI001A96676B|nr:TonB-dependent receptor [Pedobacter sp. SYSU D00873]
MKRILLTMLLLLSSILIFAQSTTLGGKVVSAAGESLPGASVKVNGTGTNTNSNGEFLLKNLPAKKLNLVVTYTGFAAHQEEVDLSAGSKTDLVITLKSDHLALTEVVVTGTANPRTKLNSSLSVSTLKGVEVMQSAPRTTAEIFRAIPGIKTEASAGDGNTNITVRGVPISSGGSKYLQLQEDGLPLLQFGDIAFGTSDMFLRADQSVARIEAIRGGSASTLASNSPSGIINFISKTGSTAGGTIATSFGLDYGNMRTDLSYGAPLGKGFSFHAAGFYRQGEGPRTAGSAGNKGGQIKLNLTKTFNGGFARVYFKYLDDKAVAYMPLPIQVTGSNDNPEFSSLPGFDIKNGAMQTDAIKTNAGLGLNGLRSQAVSNGMNPVSKSVGMELNFKLGLGWTVENRGRYAANSGGFISPFPAMIGSTSEILGAVGGATNRVVTGGRLVYAENGTTFTGSKAMVVHMFDTELNNLDNLVNDFKLKKRLGNADLALGFYQSRQNIKTSWLWNSYVQEVSGENAKTLDIVSVSGTNISENGQFAYGVPLWGNLHRNYNTTYNTSAPYAGLSLPVTKALSLDVSARYDIGNVSGSYAGNKQTSYDVNGNGNISAAEQSVSTINQAAASPVDYGYKYFSYSAGANFMISQAKAIFGRYSKGATAKADRILFTPNVLADGSAVGVVDDIKQAELGYKYKYNKGGVFLTGFYANVNENGGLEATTQRVIENDYVSYGLEFEGVHQFSKQVELRGSTTYTHARINSGPNKGNKPRRQADVIFNLTPTYKYNNLTAGLSISGTTKTYAQDNNKLVLPGYTLVNPFVSYRFAKRFTGTLNANNVFNTLGITESEEGEISGTGTSIIRARPVTGRTIAAGLSYNF